MEKIKSVFRPGGSKDDEVMYGTPEPKDIHKDGTSGQGEKEVEKLETNPGQKDHGVMRQIFNPGGEKYSDASYGTTAHSADHPDKPGPEGDQLFTQPGKEKASGGVMSQIMNPGGEKYDETRYGTTAYSETPLNVATTGTESHAATNAPQIESHEAADDKKGVLRQVLNPGGGKYDEQRYGQTGTTVAGMLMRSRMPEHDDGASVLSIKSGMHGPYADAADRGTTGTEPDRNASTAGATAGHALPVDPSTQGTSAQDYSMSGAAPTAGPSSTGAAPISDPAASRYGTDEAYRQDPSSASQAQLGRDPTLSSTQDTSTTGQSHLGRDAALAGAGTAGAGALASEANKGDDDISRATYTERSYPIGGSSNTGTVPGDSFGLHHHDEKPAEGYVHHTGGPHATDIANRLDPHVPGEFPSETGEGPHNSTFGRDAAIGGAGLGAAGLGAAGYEASQPRAEPPMAGASDPSTSAHPISTTANTMSSAPPAAQGDAPEQQQHHYGRDAALAGGAGAAGLGAYEATKDRDDPASAYHPATSTGQSLSDMPGRAEPGVQSDPAPTQEPEHHYGRDAALAGGAGAAGVGAYEMAKDRDDTGLASKTVGSHDSNVANVMDPRVKPEPEKMKESTTTGPYKSDMLNKADPRVTPDPARSAEKEQPSTQPEEEHHYGRDAAIAGGVGAAGLGAYEAAKPRDEARPTKEELIRASQDHGRPDDGKLHKSHAQEEKHERDLQKAREKEAAHGGDKGEKKESFLHKILHPGSKDKHADEKPQQQHEYVKPAGYSEAQKQSHHVGTDGAIGDDRNVSGMGPNANKQDEYVTEPHTGLPMNVGKYGDGHGGTDGAQQIEGFHKGEEHERADWDNIKKMNTPY